MRSLGMTPLETSQNTTSHKMPLPKKNKNPATPRAFNQSNAPSTPRRYTRRIFGQMNADTTSVVVFFDGPCVLCQRSVQWMAGHLRSDVSEHALKFASLQGDLARRLLQERLRTAPLPGVVVWQGGDVRVAEDALCALAPFLMAPWSWLCRAVPGWGYAWVARNRTAWFGTRETCTWSPEVQARLAEPGQA